MTPLRYILDSKYRSNPRYELIEWNCLSQPEQQSLAGLCEDQEVFGIFKPLVADPLLSYKVAYKEVALLFYALQHQTVLPAYARINDSDIMNKQIARLVLEGILEIEGENDFLSGAAALEALYTKRETISNAEASFIANLSQNALRYVAHLSEPDIRGIASRLYCYNTIPIFAEKAAGIRSSADVERFLKISDETSWSLLPHWDKMNSNGRWLNWIRKGVKGPYGENSSIYKMYISPIVELLPETFQKSIKVLSSSKAFSFKVGADFHGLVRPDKMVVYFYEHEHLIETAVQLRSVLGSIRSQGVPFTAQLDDTGLLSWGVDPPGKDVLENFEGGSWRARITERLAAAITQAVGIGLKQQDIVDYALHKIALEGIDTHTWIPEKNIWKN